MNDSIEFLIEEDVDKLPDNTPITVELGLIRQMQEECARLRKACQKLAYARRARWSNSDSSNEPYVVTDDDVKLAKTALKGDDDD